MEQNKPKVDLNLDDLIKDAKLVRINGKDIKITPPGLRELLELIKVGSSMQSRQKEEWVKEESMTELEKQEHPEYETRGGYSKKTLMTAEQSLETFAQLNNLFVRLLPELKDEKVTIQQLLQLLEFIISDVVPSDIEELKKRGIKVSTDEKKILSTLTENLPESSISTPATIPLVY